MVLLLDGVEATGAGLAYRVGDGQRIKFLNKYTVQIWWTNSGGSVTAMTVDLEGSLNGSHWFTLASHGLTAGEITAKAAMYHVEGKVIEYVRGNITALTETGTTKVYVGFSPTFLKMM